MGVLEGKVAIVSGAGQGLGRSHALTLAREGAAVVCNDLAAPAAVVEEIVGRGGRAVAAPGSVSSWSVAAGLVDLAVSEFGDLHIVVNNAGITRDKMSWAMDEDEWDSVVDVHLKGHFAVSRHAGVYWRDQAKAGATAPRRLINTTSEAGMFGSAGQSNYAPAKGGIVTLTWVLARELGRYGVTANVIAPRARTAMTENMAFVQRPVEGGFDKYDPAHVSELVAWLASDSTSDITAQIFVVLGGEVHLVKPFRVLNSVRASAGLSISALEAARGELFAGQATEPPDTNIGM